MIRVTVELVSAISRSRDCVLGVMEIANTGDGTPLLADYEAALDQAPEFLDFSATLSKREPKQRQIWRRAKVCAFPRKRLGVWDLMYRVLREAVGERNR